MLVTAIEPRRKGLSALFLDGEFAMNLDTETLLKAGMKPGVELDDEQLHTLIQSSDRRRAEEKALFLLEHRSHSQKELADKISRVASREAAEAAAARMAKLGLVDDEAYAKSLAAELLNRKGYSAARARQELQRRGIDRELAQQVVEESAPDPVEKLMELIQRRYAGNLAEEKGRRRCIAALQRLGYHWDDIRTALRRVGGEVE